jgi:hypothetical protein
MTFFQAAMTLKIITFNMATLSVMTFNITINKLSYVLC